MNKNKLIKDINYVEDTRKKMGENSKLWKDHALYRTIYAILEILYDILLHIKKQDFSTKLTQDERNK